METKSLRANVCQPHLKKTRCGWGVLLSLLVVCPLVASLASASHKTVTPTEVMFEPIGLSNEKVVYLSSPRHISSGSRGELGWEENINGRHWNYYAATGDYMDGSITSLMRRNLRSRGYKVIVSPNSRDGNIQESINRSNALQADVHITTHTNAIRGPGTGDYLLLIIDQQTASAEDKALRYQLAQSLGPKVPGNEVLTTDVSGYTNGGNLGELAVNAVYTVYVELIFHDNQSHVNWFGSGDDWGASVKHHAWRYGDAIDRALRFPKDKIYERYYQ